MPCDHPPSFSLPFQVPILHFNGLTGSKDDGTKMSNNGQMSFRRAKFHINSTSQTKRVLRLTHSEICCFSSPLSDRHQCRGTISKGDLNISLGIGAMVVLRNAAGRPFSPRFNSSVGAEKEISPQHPSHACSWPEPQLSEKMLMQALSVFSERRHALFKPASVWGGGVFPAASPFSLLSSIFIEWPVRLQQHAGLTPHSANGKPPPSCTSHPHLTTTAPKNWIFSPTPPLLTQHYKVWQSIHSLFLV